MTKVHDSVSVVQVKKIGQNQWHIIKVDVPNIDIFMRQSFIRNKNILLIFSLNEDHKYPDINSLQMNNNICWFEKSDEDDEEEEELESDEYSSSKEEEEES